MQGYVTLPLDMQSHGLGPAIWTVIAVNGFLIILVTIPISNMAARWPRFETIAVSAVLLGLGFGFTAFATNFPLFASSVVIWTLGEIAGPPFANYYCRSFTSETCAAYIRASSGQHGDWRFLLALWQAGGFTSIWEAMCSGLVAWHWDSCSRCVTQP